MRAYGIYSVYWCNVTFGVIFFVVKEEFGKRVKEGIMCGEKLSAGESKNLNSWRLFCHFHGRVKSKIYRCLLFILSGTIEGQVTVSDT